MFVRAVTALWPQRRKHRKGEGKGWGKKNTNVYHVYCQTERVMSESVLTTNLVRIYVRNIYINIIYNNKRFSRAGRGSSGA